MFKQEILCPKNKRNARDLFFGSRVSCVKFDTMPCSRFGNESHAVEWAIEKPSMQKVESYVERRVDVLRSGYFTVNGKCLILDYPVLTKRLGYWRWVKPRALKEGDIIYTSENGETPVLTHEFTEIKVQTVELKIAMYDTFFLNGVLVHNKVV